MATEGTYYFDTGSFTNATAIYTDSSLTTLAADGFYSNGTVVREQSSGILLPEQACHSCTPTPSPVPVPVPVPIPVPVPVPVPVPSAPATYYSLTRCSDSSTGWRTQQQTNEISLGLNDRVQGSTMELYIVTGSVTTGNNVGLVSYTGQLGCPPTPVPVPVPTPIPSPVPVPTPSPMIYYAYNTDATKGNGSASNAEACQNITDTDIWSTNAATIGEIGIGTRFTTNGSGIPDYWQGQSKWYAISPNGNFGPAGFSVRIDNSGTVISKTNCSTPTPTPSPVPVAPTPVPVPSATYYYYAIERCDGILPTYLAARSSVQLVPGKAVLMPDGNCYEILAGGPVNSDDIVSQYKNCTFCENSNP